MIRACALIGLAWLALPASAQPPAECDSIVGWVGIPLCQAAGVGDVPVPDVTALDVTAADIALEADGLDTGVVTAVCSSESADQVVNQNPAAGILVASGSLVDLLSSDGSPCPGSVPLKLNVGRIGL